MVKNITVNATSIYVTDMGAADEDGAATPQKVGEDVEVTLPEIKAITTTASAMGDFDVPVIGQLENMEFKLHHTGVDANMTKLLKQKVLDIEVRFVQQVFNDDGTSSVIGCKAMLKVFPVNIAPEIGVKKGEVSDNEIAYGVIKYQMFCNGEELWNVDRLNHKLVIDGVDYYTDISGLL